MIALAVTVIAIVAFRLRRRVLAERDVPELMRVLWASYDRQLRVIYPAMRGEDALFLDSKLSKERLIAASGAAERAGLVVRQYHRGLIGGDTFVGIAPRLVGRQWEEPTAEDPWYVHEQGGQWRDPAPAPWLSSFVNFSGVGSKA